MYHVFQEEEGTQVIIREIAETIDELNELLESPTQPVKFVYDDITDSYSHVNGYSLQECQDIVRTTRKAKS